MPILSLSAACVMCGLMISLVAIDYEAMSKARPLNRMLIACLRRTRRRAVFCLCARHGAAKKDLRSCAIRFGRRAAARRIYADE